MKIPGIVFVLLLFCLPASAQQLPCAVKFGEPFDAPKRSTLSDIIDHDASGFFAVKMRAKGFISRYASYTLDHYGKNMNPTGSIDLDIQEEGYDCYITEFLPLGGRLFVFYSYQNTKTKHHIEMVDEIDKKTLKTKRVQQVIGDIDYSGNSKRNSGSFSIRVSRDSSKVLLYFDLPDAQGDPEQLGFKVLDSNMTPVWEKTVTLPYKGGLYDVQALRVDNTGNVYMLGLAYKERRAEKRNGEPNYTYEAVAYTENGNRSKKYLISLPDKFITDMQIEVQNNTLVCGGFYSEQGTYSIRGTYFLTVDAASGEVKTKSFKEFGIDFISQNLTERQAKRAARREEQGKDPEIYNYDLHRLLIGRDGSAVMIGEQFFVRVSTQTTFINGSAQTRQIYHYYYNDIIAVKMDAEGQILWAEKIAKAQHSMNDGGFFASYALALVNGKICFIFNDNPDNLDYDGKGRPTNTILRKAAVVLVSLDKEGKQTKQPLFTSKDVEVMIRPKVCEQISNHEVILFGQRGKHQQFASVAFK